MNFISNLLRGTHTDSDKHVERPKVSDEEDEEHAAAARRGLPPSTTTEITNLHEGDRLSVSFSARKPLIPQEPFARSSPSRARSLSRVYNQVPRGRPDFLTAQQDMIEYYAHLAMIETDADRVKEEDRNLREALRGCTFRNYGRLYSRLQIACLCISIGAYQTDPENLLAQEEEDDHQGDGLPSDFILATYWKALREQLIIVKTYMLRKDANAPVPIEKPGYENEEDEDIPDEDDELDAVLEKHEMFQDNYEEVLLLIEVQVVLSTFCERVSSINTKAESTEEVLHELESAVDSYESELRKLFMPEGVPKGADIGEETKSQIPEELTKFVLTELYKRPNEAVTLLLRDALAVMTNDECVYSHAQLKQKVSCVR